MPAEPPRGVAERFLWCGVWHELIDMTRGSPSGLPILVCFCLLKVLKSPGLAANIADCLLCTAAAAAAVAAVFYNQNRKTVTTHIYMYICASYYILIDPLVPFVNFQGARVT